MINKISDDQFVFETEIYYVTDYHELDDIVSGMYGFDRDSYSVALDQNNDTTLQWNVRPEPACHENVDLAYGDSGKRYAWQRATAYDFLCELAYFGIIPFGEYIISISW